MNVLVTGGAGYVGTVLIPELLKNNNVKCLDRFFFGKEFLSSKEFSTNLQLIDDDIRWFDKSILKGIDIVIDLAAISNDPAGELDPQKTLDINYLGKKRVAQLSKEMGVKRYVLASTASVYGFQKGVGDEESETNPLTTYAEAARLAEKAILPLNDKDFTVSVLRFGTLFGLSARMRFDLVVNTMTHTLFSTGKIIVAGDGMQGRALLHVKDAALAYQTLMMAPEDKIGKQIFNTGSDKLRYKIKQIAEEIGESIGIEYKIEHKGSKDNRSYTASFQKIKTTLDFESRYTIRDTALEIFNALKTNKVAYTKKTITLEWYKHLIKSGVI